MGRSLDLSDHGTLSIGDLNRIDQLYSEVLQEYNLYTHNLIVSNDVDGLQWLLRVTVRNNQASQLLDRMCRLALLDDLLQYNSRINTVIIDTRVMLLPVRQMLEKHNCAAHVTIRRKKSLPTWFWLNFSMNLVWSANLWFWPKFFKKRNQPQGPTILIDTFVSLASVDERGHFHDRLYGDLTERAGPTTPFEIWHSPTWSDLPTPWSTIKLLRRIARGPNNILVHAKWLSLKHYVYAITQSVKLPTSISLVPEWRGLTMYSLVHEELAKDKGSFTLTQSILGYCFIGELKKNKVHLIGVIDWFENQAADRALNLAMKNFFPGVKTKGYMGILFEGFSAAYVPTQLEYNKGTLPDELLVIAKTFIPNKRRACPNLPVSLAPALRFTGNNSNRGAPIDRRSIVLLALPIDLYLAKRILEIALQAYVDTNYHWMVKIHPAISKKYFFKRIMKSRNPGFDFTDAPLPDLLDKVRIVVTCASGTAVETILRGVPVAIIGNPSGPTINPLEGFVEYPSKAICRTANDLNKMIKDAVRITDLSNIHSLYPNTRATRAEMLRFRK
jgi:hypothetical protein